MSRKPGPGPATPARLTIRFVPGGGYTMRTWRQLLPPMLEWMTRGLAQETSAYDRRCPRGCRAAARPVAARARDNRRVCLTRQNAAPLLPARAEVLARWHPSARPCWTYLHVPLCGRATGQASHARRCWADADLLLGVMRAAPGMARVPGASRRAALATGGAARLLRAAAHVGAPVAARRGCGREPGAVRRTDPALARRADPEGARARFGRLSGQAANTAAVSSVSSLPRKYVTWPSRRRQ